jgi:tetratricopeptide (TPR) repeat protein
MPLHFVTQRTEGRAIACSALIEADQQDVVDLASAFNRRGHAHFNLGQTEPAIQDFDQAIKRDPNNIQAFYNRAIAYFSIHQAGRDTGF